MGSGTGAGKSTVCMVILAQLLAAGFDPKQLAYIKPVTQCIAQQPVALFCEHTGIAYVDIGPLVFKKGFSKEFIAGLTKPAAVLMPNILALIRNLGKDKAIVIIDGIGHPAVGSVVGVSNVDLALALSAKALFVGNPGVGAALDNTVLCVSFMQTKGLNDIGVLYNKIPVSAFSGIKRLLSQRLPELLPDIILLGFIGDDITIKTPWTDNCDDVIAHWANAYLDANTLHDWLGLKAASAYRNH